MYNHICMLVFISVHCTCTVCLYVCVLTIHVCLCTNYTCMSSAYRLNLHWSAQLDLQQQVWSLRILILLAKALVWYRQQCTCTVFAYSIFICRTWSTGGIDDGLITQFFGENKDKKLTVKEFHNFHEALRLEVLQLEVQYMYSILHLPGEGSSI